MSATQTSASAPLASPEEADGAAVPAKPSSHGRCDDQGCYALLTDGSSVEIRQARHEDAEAVRSMHAAMSQDNLYLRFFSLSPSNAEREAERVCRAAEPGHVALLA